MKILMVSVMLLVTAWVNGQQAEGYLRGIVTDSLSNRIGFATISLINLNTRQNDKTVFTDSSGRFLFSPLPKGRYYLQTSATGYETKISDTLQFETDSSYEVGIVLSVFSKELKAVIVETKRAAIYGDGEKIAYSVQDDPSAKGLTLPELLARLPFVSVAGEGSVSLKGRSNFKILLNGKSSSLLTSGSDFLKSFPADLIERIEILNSAGARYEGEDVAGIINIITKPKLKGYKGAVAFNANTIGQLNPNTSFNLKTGKLGMSVFAYQAKNLGYDVQGGTVFTDKVSWNTRRILEDGKNKGYQTGLSLEVVYDFDSLQVLSLYGRIAGAGGENERQASITSLSPSNTLIDFGFRNTVDVVRLPGYETGIDYIIQGRNKNETSVSLNLQKNRNEIVTNSQDRSRSLITREIMNSSRATNGQSVISIDKSIFKNRNQFELGSKIILRDVRSNYAGLYRILPDYQFTYDSANSNFFRYNQHLYAAYFSWRYQSEKKWSVRLGMRAEKTTVNASFKSSLQKTRQNYTSLLPAINVSKLLGKFNLNFSYQRKIARPGVSYLNPYIDNRDTAFIVHGNTNLKPEISEQIDAVLSKFSARFSFSSGISFVQTRGTIQRVIEYQPATGKGEQSFKNSGVSNQLGFNGFVSLNPAPSWTVSSNITLYLIQFRHKGEASEFSRGKQYNLNGSIRYDNKKRVYYYSNINYSSPATQLAGKSPAYLFYNLGAGYRAFSDKLTVTLTALNFLQENRNFSSVNETGTLLQEINFYRPFRSFSLGIRFNFGQLKQSVSRKKELSVDDIKEVPNNKL